MRVPRTDAQRIAYRYAATGHMHGFPWHRVEWERGIPSLSSAAPPLLQRSKRLPEISPVKTWGGARTLARAGFNRHQPQRRDPRPVRYGEAKPQA